MEPLFQAPFRRLNFLLFHTGTDWEFPLTVVLCSRLIMALTSEGKGRKGLQGKQVFFSRTGC